MIAAVILHQMRVFFTGAYQRPRELNWVVGMALLMCTLVIGFTGYSLVFEQLSYWGATVGGNICEAVPLVGGRLPSSCCWAARTTTSIPCRDSTSCTRPCCRRDDRAAGRSTSRSSACTASPSCDSRTNRKSEPQHFNFFPDHVFTELMIGLVLMVVLSALATSFRP